MFDDEKLVELLVRRDDLLEQGRGATPEEVCEDCPELLEEYKARLESLKTTDWLFETDDGEDGGSLNLPLSATASIIEPELPSSSLTIDQFLRAITDSGLMTEEEIQAFQPNVTTDVSSNTQSLARELVQRRKLTLYQASVLLSERSDPLLLDRYIILDTIDAGGMGLVFKALHRSMDRVVALKTLPPSSLDSEEKIKRFQREVKTAAMLSHPNIVITHDAHESNGVHFLVMEYVKGRDLGKVVKAEGPLPIARAVHYLLQAARGLEHAHAQGIIHRDIKPGNLLLDADGTVKVLDLGLARLETLNGAATETEEDLTALGGVMGTVSYMSPEQAANTHDADARSDIYSLGCTLYYLLIGEPPYKENTLVNTILAHRDKPIPPLREKRDDIPEDVIAVYRRMMAKKPEDRYQSMTEVVGALSSCQAAKNEPVGAVQSSDMAEETIAYTPAESQKRRSWLWALGAVVVLVLVAQFFFSTHLKTNSDRPFFTVRSENDSNNLRRPSADSTNTLFSDRQASRAVLEKIGLHIPQLAIAPFTPEEAEQHQQAWADYLGIPVEFKNSIGMKMVLIPPGEFMMGSSEEEIAWWVREGEIQGWSKGEVESYRSEEPQHKVKITEPLFIAAHELTVGQFKKFVEATAYKTEAEVHDTGVTWENPEPQWGTTEKVKQTDQHPVAAVSWHDAVAVCNWLSKTEEREYKLPTEAQWEYACRAGSTKPCFFGDVDVPKLEQHAWFMANSEFRSWPVGLKLPNGFGIYDVYGNVWEWCSDWYADDYYDSSPQDNPSGPASGIPRVLRGGSFNHQLQSQRSANRDPRLPTTFNATIGFRPVLLIAPTNLPKPPAGE